MCDYIHVSGSLSRRINGIMRGFKLCWAKPNRCIHTQAFIHACIIIKMFALFKQLLVLLYMCTCTSMNMCTTFVNGHLAGILRGFTLCWAKSNRCIHTQTFIHACIIFKMFTLFKQLLVLLHTCTYSDKNMCISFVNGHHIGTVCKSST